MGVETQMSRTWAGGDGGGAPRWAVGASVLLLSCAAYAGGVVPDAPQAESPAVAKNRFISFVPGNAGQQVALRVTFGSMSALDRRGQVRWVGPAADEDDCDVTAATYRGAALQCAPYYTDWGGASLIHVTSQDHEVLPDSVYAVQAIFQGADIEDEANYSAPLIVVTGSVYTDIVGWWTGAEWTAPDGLVTFHDVAAGLDKFVGRPTISHVRVKMHRCDLFVCPGFDAFDHTITVFEGGDLTPLPGCSTADPCGQLPRFICGNSVLEPAEQCDDGNTTPGDGCDERCILEPACGNGLLDAPEQCDDGGTISGDGCDAQCRFETECGNGRLEPGEQCDDGNTAPLDGCDADCQSEQATAVLALLPVDSDGPHAIVDRQIRLGSGDQRVFLELRLFDWDPDLTGAPGVRHYQAQIAPESFGSGMGGTVGPPMDASCDIFGPSVCVGGSDAGTSCNSTTDCETRECNNAHCTAEFGAGSRCIEGRCATGYITQNRTDLLISNTDGGYAVVDTTTPGFRFGGTQLISGAILDEGTEKYLGTLVLQASSDARGTFTIGLKDGYAETFLLDDANLLIPFAEVQPAIITINTGCCLGDGTCVGDAETCEALGGTLVPVCGEDCDGDGENDSCAILGGAVDCDDDGVPDECQSGDCQPNGVVDTCDIAGGTSDDCNFDQIPDECQPDEDCNTNGTKDICDIGAGTSFDCNLNLTPDECDLAGGSLDDNGNSIPDECEEAPGPDPLPYPNTRTLSIAPSSQPAITALRVRLVKIYNTDGADPDNAFCAARAAPLADLSVFDGQFRWAGPPQAYPDEAIPPMPDFVAAELQCCPHFRNWSPLALAEGFPAADTDLIHLFGREVLPCSEYEVQVVSINCPDLSDESCYSEALTVRTARLGDVWEPFAPYSSGQPAFVDIGAEVSKFKGLPYDPKAYSGAPPKYRAMLRGNVPPLHEKVNFMDIGQAVLGFKYLPYPEQGPVDCEPCP